MKKTYYAEFLEEAPDFIKKELYKTLSSRENLNFLQKELAKNAITLEIKKNWQITFYHINDLEIVLDLLTIHIAQPV